MCSSPRCQSVCITLFSKSGRVDRFSYSSREYGRLLVSTERTRHFIYLEATLLKRSKK